MATNASATLNSRKNQNIEKKTFLLIVMCAAMIAWLLAFLISSIVSIFFIDHTFTGWFIQKADIGDQWKLTPWSYIFIIMGFLVSGVSIVTSILYYKDIGLRLRASEHEIAAAVAAKKLANQASGLNSDKLMGMFSDEEKTKTARNEKIKEKFDAAFSN